MCLFDVLCENKKRMNLQFNGSEMFMQTGGSMAGSDVATQDEHENKQQAVDSAGNQRILRPFWGGFEVAKTRRGGNER